MGVGNPLLGDDGAGFRLVEILKEKYGDKFDEVGIELKEACSGNIGILQELIGYEEAIIVDSISQKNSGLQEGKILELNPQDFVEYDGSVNMHTLDFASSYRLFKSSFRDRMPRKVKIFAIVIKDQNEYREDLSEKIDRAVNNMVYKILSKLND